MAKLPALQFYPGDWKKDLGQSCGIEGLPDAPGCYVVYVDGDAVYVGQSSTSVRDRLCLGHGFNYARYSNFFDTPWGQCRSLSFKVKTFSRFGAWLSLEARLIRRLRPIRNRLGVANG